VDIDELTNPTIFIPVVGVLFILVGVVIGAVQMSSARKKKDLVPRWARGAYGLWTGGEDSGTWDPGRAARSLSSWYGAGHVGALRDVITDLERGTTGAPAWDLVRALDLLRIGVAAGYIDKDECWTISARICARLQSMYQGWEQMAQAFEAGMNAWQARSKISDPNETGRVKRNLPRLRAEIWPQAPWSAKLEYDD
jgi:hypothetical protein